MSAVDRVLAALPKFHRLREGEYRARCPVHQGKSNTSLSIKEAGDRVLIHCHQGCDLRDILAALGMKSAAELFDTVRSAPDPELQRRRDAERGFHKWREQELTRTATELRRRDDAVRRIDDAVRA